MVSYETFTYKDLERLEKNTELFDNLIKLFKSESVKYNDLKYYFKTFLSLKNNFIFILKENNKPIAASTGHKSNDVYNFLQTKVKRGYRNKGYGTMIRLRSMCELFYNHNVDTFKSHLVVDNRIYRINKKIANRILNTKHYSPKLLELENEMLLKTKYLKKSTKPNYVYLKRKRVK